MRRTLGRGPNRDVASVSASDMVAHDISAEEPNSCRSLLGSVTGMAKHVDAGSTLRHFLVLLARRMELADILIDIRDLLIRLRIRTLGFWRLMSARRADYPDGVVAVLRVRPPSVVQAVPALVRSSPSGMDAIAANVDAAVAALGSIPVTGLDRRRGRITIDPGDIARAQNALRDSSDLLMTPLKDGRAIPANAVGSSVEHAPGLVFVHRADPSGQNVYDERFGCEISFSNARSQAPRPWPFPIDAVYTWVDDRDERWRERRVRYSGDRAGSGASGDSRYRNRDELRYSLRSLDRYAEFVRTVYVVTDGQKLPWLSPHQERVVVVDHRDIFPDRSCLPTFNSHSIEACLHRIGPLAEQFLYLNDDFFFARPCLPELFFERDGRSRSFPSQALVNDPLSGSAPLVDAAGRRAGDLMRMTFGSAPRHKYVHAPYPLRRSVLYDLEERFAAEIASTRRSRFRSADDVPLLSSLYHHYALRTSAAVRSQIAAGYIDLGRPHLRQRMLKARHDPELDVFCLNDSETHALQARLVDRIVARQLRAWFPEPASFEQVDVAR